MAEVYQMVERGDRQRCPENEQEIAGRKVLGGEPEEAVGQLLAKEDDVWPHHAAAVRQIASKMRGLMSNRILSKVETLEFVLLLRLENTFGSVCVRSLGNSTVALRRKYLPL